MSIKLEEIDSIIQTCFCQICNVLSNSLNFIFHTICQVIGNKLDIPKLKDTSINWEKCISQDTENLIKKIENRNELLEQKCRSAESRCCQLEDENKNLAYDKNNFQRKISEIDDQKNIEIQNKEKEIKQLKILCNALKQKLS